MAYFYGQWKLNSGVKLSGSYSCTINFTAGGGAYKEITIGQNGVSFIAENGDPFIPEEEYGTDIIDFGEGVRATSIDKGFCGAFMDSFAPYSENTKIIGIDPAISLVGNFLTITRRAYADLYFLYVNGSKVYEFSPGEFANSVDLTNYISDDGDKSYDICVAAYYEDDVFDSEGRAIPFSVMSNTVAFSFTSEPDEPEEPDVPTDPEEPDEPTEVTAYLIKTETLTDIANAIRERRGFTYQIPAVAFAQEIRDIEHIEEQPSTEDLDVTENGVYNPEDYGVEYFSTVRVMVEGGNSNATTTALDFTNYANGSFTETLSNGLVLTHTVVFDGGTPTLVDNIEVRGV